MVEDGNAAQAFDRVCTANNKMLRLVCDVSSLPSWSSITQFPPGVPPNPTESNPDDTALIMFTSGTSNFPKGCPLSVRNIITEIQGYHSFHASNWDASCRLLATTLCFRPICYLGCLNSWQAGGCVIIPSNGGISLNADSTLKILSEQKVTHMMLVPYQLRSLIGPSLLDNPDHRPTSLRFVTCSGDSCSASIIAAAKEKLQTPRLILHWGMSEGAPLFGWVGDEPVPVLEKSNIPSIGRALPGTRVRVCEAGTSEMVSRGIIGELQVDSDSLIDRYISDEHTRGAFFEDGQGRWFRTGDLAVLNDSGVVFVVGRSKDQIMNKGFGIVPSIVEDCLEKGCQVEVGSMSVV